MNDMATNPQTDETPRPKPQPQYDVRLSAGRPSLYDPEIAEEICDKLANGTSLRRICADPEMPSRSAVLDWLDKYPEFHAKYARAREAQGEYANDDIEEVERELRDGEIDAATARVLIASKQWRAAKLKPKVYGDSTLLKHADANGEKIPSHIDPSKLSPDERDQLRQLMIAMQQRALEPPEAEYEEIEDDPEG